MIPIPVETWFAENDFGPVMETRSVGGGCISNGQTLTTKSGETFFLKTNTETPADMFAREAEGLAALEVDNGPRVPRPLLFGCHFILL